jgi:hypothetical protein
MACIVDTVQDHVEATGAADIEEECLSEMTNSNDVMVCFTLYAA